MPAALAAGQDSCRLSLPVKQRSLLGNEVYAADQGHRHIGRMAMACMHAPCCG